MPRIRTVKPEFWQSESMAGVSLHARLLALAILNQCDDEGYFPANVALVRAACFPFDDDAEAIVQSLGELVAIDYIEIRTDEGGRRVGHVCKFSEHQRINRPKPSKLKDLFRDADDDVVVVSDEAEHDHGTITDESVIHHDTITDVSPLERKGREQGSEQGKGTGNAKALSVCVFPATSPGTSTTTSAKSTTGKRSAPRPTLADITQHCRDRGNAIDPEAFFAFYEANGWRQSNGNRIVDWKAAVVTWEKRSAQSKDRANRPATFAEIRTSNTDDAFREVFHGS